MRTWMKYLITFTVGLAISALIIFPGVFKQETESDVLKVIVNGFFVPGIFILGFGLLVLASNGGTFDMLIYGTKKFFDMFRKPQYRKINNTFYDYRKAKQEYPGEFLYLILTGLGFIIISLIFLIFYYQV